ncbi:uncharacterized protein LOC26526591 [Drosophila erecta]|uniref:uncharacterized protein LOC26526591 n=1 Tax=Drosophila erecta TaxID=7220 RepID=UPI000732B104|nr:uncharacterized protein LOC26526591 [Drosophila erecta]KQS52253.1 uncharacterized protein Dere_GG26767 [Drosophila erecta]
MSLAVLTFLVLCGFSFLGQHEVVADCAADSSDLWNDDTNEDEGSCTRTSLKNDIDDQYESIDNDPIIRESEGKVAKKDNTNSDVQFPLFENIIKIFKFIWQMLSIWINWK